MMLPSRRCFHVIFLALAALGASVESEAAGAEPRPKIAWYGTLSGGLIEAKRSGRPILLVSAAPHCHGVSGVW